MKRIILAIAAITAIAACTKSEVTYEAPGEIGFNVVAGNITKAPATGTAMPEDLHMYVNAYVHADADSNTDGIQFPDAPDYINNGEFKFREAVTDDGKTIKLWGGEEERYYWPNEQKLHFSGFSKSGNATKANASYNPETDVLTINGYEPGKGTDLGKNDLMWFPSTIHSKPAGYGKEGGKFPDYVEVEMYHTCSWLTFMVQGDETTGGTNSTYKITSLKINDIDLMGNVTCDGTKATLTEKVVWDPETTKEDETYVVIENANVNLRETFVEGGESKPKNIETGKVKAFYEGNVVVIPQIPGKIDIEWTYESSTGEDITDSATDLDLKLGSNVQSWEPGKHYIYTITLKANEILIAPTPDDWTESLDNNVTVE